MSELPKLEPEKTATISQEKGEKNMRCESKARPTPVERAAESLSSEKGKQELLRKMRYIFNEFAERVEEGTLAVLIPSKGQKEARGIVQDLTARFGQNQVVVFDFSGLLGRPVSIKDVAQQIEGLSESPFSNGKVVLLHPEISLTGDELLRLRAIVSHEEVFERNQAILITDPEEFDRRGEDDPCYGGWYARNIYVVVGTELDLGKTSLGFDETKAGQAVTSFCRAFQALRNRSSAELYLEPRSGKSTLIRAFASWWRSRISLSEDSLVNLDFHEYLDEPDPFESLKKTIGSKTEKYGTQLFIIDEAQNLTDEQKLELCQRFPEQKFFFIGHT